MHKVQDRKSAKSTARNRLGGSAVGRSRYRLPARLLCLVLALWVGFVGQVRAAFPVALVPGAALVFDSGAMAGSYAAAIGLVGAAVAFVTIPSSETSTGLDVRISPSSSPLTPSGWTPGSGGSAPVPPGSVTGTPGTGDPDATCARCDGTSCGYQESCALCSVWAANVPGGHCEVQGGGGNYSPTTCPPGYTASGSGCVLSNPDSVSYPPDGRCGIGRGSDGVMRADSRDPDCSGVPNLNAGAGRVDVANGNNRIVVTQNPDGSYTVTQTVGNGDGTSTQNQYSISGSGQLTGGTTGQVSGEGSGAGGSSGTGGVGGTGNENNAGSCGGPGQPACRIDDSGFAGKDAGLPDKQAQANAAYADRDNQLRGTKDVNPDWKFDWLPSTKPGAPVACKPLTVSAAISHGPAAGLGSSHQIDICSQLSVLREYMAWLVSILTVYYLWGVLVGRSSEGRGK